MEIIQKNRGAQWPRVGGVIGVRVSRRLERLNTAIYDQVRSDRPVVGGTATRLAIS